MRRMIGNAPEGGGEEDSRGRIRDAEEEGKGEVANGRR